MEEREVVRLVSQYLHEHGFQLSLETLEKESGREFKPEVMEKKSGELQAILGKVGRIPQDEHSLREQQQRDAASSVEHLVRMGCTARDSLIPRPPLAMRLGTACLVHGVWSGDSHDLTTLFFYCKFGPGKGEYANHLWCSFNDFTSGFNVLVVRLIENGVLAFGASKSQVGIAEFPIPLPMDGPPITPIPTIHKVSKGAVLAVDFHPQKRNLLLCGSMDRLSFLLDLDSTDNPLVQKFEDHAKYVVRCCWAPSGKYFVTASYDKTACAYRSRDDGSGLYELVQRLEFIGAVEGLAFAKDADVFVVSVRNDYLLHCYDLTSGSATESRVINVNAFGDDYVSFVPMHLSFSPDGRCILISTDRDRLIMYSWETGKQIANFYGAKNDEYSQPRHCWDPSGKYIYGTSDNQSIYVWETRSQSIVARLEGHTGTVRDLHFCKELGILVSCGFDGTVKFWRSKTSLGGEIGQEQT